MKARESSPFPVVLRRAIAVIEFGAAGLLLLFGIESSINPGRRVGGDGIATGIMRAFALPFILIGVGLALAAVTAWLGRRKWWAWQAAMVAWGISVLVVTFLVLILVSP
jgi:hypothetical protein